MKLRMGIENGHKFENGIMPLNKDIMSIKVNGVELDMLQSIFRAERKQVSRQYSRTLISAHLLT